MKIGYHWLLLCLAIFGSNVAQAQQSSFSPQRTAFDLYSALRQDERPESLAVRLKQAVNMYRFDCQQVSDYQVFERRPNLVDLKVKCIGIPLYAVTVASNGYLGIMGGNNIIAGFDRVHGRIYSFLPDGTLEPEVVPEMSEYVEESYVKMKLGDEKNMVYLMFAVGFMIFVGLGGFLLWLRIWRRLRANRGFHRGIDTTMKDIMVQEGTRVGSDIFKHTSGMFISKGRKGKRRVFHSYFSAFCYRYLGMKINEVRHLSELEHLEEEKSHFKHRDIGPTE